MQITMVNNVVALTVKVGLISFWCEPIFCILHNCCFTVVVNMSNHDKKCQYFCYNFSAFACICGLGLIGYIYEYFDF